MWPNLINLLPNEYVRALRREYVMRYAALALLALVIVVIVNGIFLIPTFLYEEQQIATQTHALNQIAKSTATTQESQVNAQLATLSQQAQALSTLSNVPTASNSIKSILAVSRPGITLTNFVYTAPTKGAPGTMQLSGTADTRENLRSYDGVLSALPFVTNANLPIEDYAQATNIAFTITLTGSFAPQ